MYREVNTGTNLPAQIEIYSTDTDYYDFLFLAKGGGSANKTFLFQQTKALLNKEKLLSFVRDKIKVGFNVFSYLLSVLSCWRHATAEGMRAFVLLTEVDVRVFQSQEVNDTLVINVFMLLSAKCLFFSIYFLQFRRFHVCRHTPISLLSRGHL